MSLSDLQMWQAVAENNEKYDGEFFYAVKSTGIFCKPSCKSKLPKRENVSFYYSAADAQKAGFRACKRCRSDLIKYDPMRDIANELKALTENLFLDKCRYNTEVRALGLSPRRAVEVFREEFGETPKAYIDFLRLKECKRLLVDTDNEIVDIAYSVGFCSVSAFYRFFKDHTGKTPGKYRRDNKE